MKPGGQYRKGVAKERWLIKQFYESGAALSFRSAGSHSPVDVIGISENCVELVQCKACPTRPPKEEYDKAQRLSSKIRCASVSLWWFKGKGDIEVTRWIHGKEERRK